eukprot:CAMPEP_0174316392 /NCGR_PEP_ID=MMETSP0810-20121108/6903_1 /TAXON_ID=73025 ORGANISM="Eutreptiella gymnastica-like, Strain CCMP1594" /NCGR_SAMPLE_ID=MMETSP0810 /ASSEMBLY_ACC=CAM_ASM_000659 /LENGTH=101 /DNA_ID=CAMNT_0015426057 /DNA_START=765 /DNA_END=1070 /DNA_ORIENTATION=-
MERDRGVWWTGESRHLEDWREEKAIYQCEGDSTSANPHNCWCRPRNYDNIDVPVPLWETLVSSRSGRVTYGAVGISGPAKVQDKRPSGAVPLSGSQGRERG